MLNGRCQIALLALLLLPSTGLRSASSYDGYRWFQVEISIFSNEFPEYRDAELWSADRLRLSYPANARQFARLSDFLAVSDLSRRLAENPDSAADAATVTGQQIEATASGREVGPFARQPATALRLPDPDRMPFLLLPPALSDFQTTNSRLERSTTNRLLFSGVWRQPVLQANRSAPLLIQGGRQFGQHHELEGTITIRFNENEDRVVIDTDLWLSEFVSGPGSDDWRLPPPPAGSADDPIENSGQRSAFGINRVVHMQESRPMRSTEFHYLDHPAMGLVISVFPYELPPPVRLDVALPAP